MAAEKVLGRRGAAGWVEPKGVTRVADGTALLVAEMVAQWSRLAR
jgi:hypothetical protein